MTKRMLIDATHPEETRVVVLDGTRLEEFDVETSTKKQIKGNIYLASIFSFGAQGPEPNSGKVIKYTIASDETEVAAEGLNQPGGVAIDGDGGVYVSNNSTCPADVTGLEGVCPAPGEVVKLNFHG